MHHQQTIKFALGHSWQGIPNPFYGDLPILLFMLIYIWKLKFFHQIFRNITFKFFFTRTLVLYSHTFDKLYIYQNVLVSQTFQCLTYYVFPHASIDLFEFTSFVHPTPTPTPTSSNPSTLFVSLFC